MTTSSGASAFTPSGLVVLLVPCAPLLLLLLPPVAQAVSTPVAETTAPAARLAPRKVRRFSSGPVRGSVMRFPPDGSCRPADAAGVTGFQFAVVRVAFGHVGRAVDEQLVASGDLATQHFSNDHLGDQRRGD